MTQRLLLALFSIGLLSLGGCGSMLATMEAEPIEEEEGERTMGRWLEDESIETKAMVNVRAANDAFDKAHLVIVSYNGYVLIAGQVSTQEFVSNWDEGDNSFSEDAPNADFTCTVDGKVVNFVVELSSPIMPGGDLSYTVKAVGDTVLPQTQMACEGETHLFVDSAYCRGGYPASFGGFWWWLVGGCILAPDM